ncbi:MAG: hypothetical protein IKQ84_09775 [Spirochaetaceae bacterium]|nr:hypothetical protein [Spirochaetaceae bacterium]
MRTSHIDSDSIYSFFEAKGIKPQVLPNKSKNTVFPYNIILDFPNKEALLSPDSENGKESKTLIIAAAQEDIPLFLDELSTYVEYLKSSPPPINVKIVLTAGDTSAVRMPGTMQTQSLEGTDMFLSSLDSSKQYTALILNIRNIMFVRNRDILITPGIPFKAAPSWLLEAIIKSCKENNIHLKVDGLFIPFYRAGLIQANPKLEAYFNENIPALLIESSSTEIFDALPSFANALSESGTKEWDFHYSMIPIGEETFFIPEIVLLIILLSTAAIALLYICIFSLFTKKSLAVYINEVKKAWFLLPMMIVITWLLFYAGQLIAKQFYPSWFFHLFSACILKATLALTMFLFLALFHRIIPFSTNDNTYAWLLIIICFANLFIFSSFDLSLLLIFSAELLLALLFLKIRRIFPMVVIGLIMILPFALMAFAIFTMPRQNILFRFFNASFLENALISCLIMPVEFTWVRIAVRLGLFGKHMKRRHFPYIISIGLFLTAAVSAVIIFQNNAQQRIMLPRPSEQKSPELNALSFEVSRSKIMNRNRIDFQVSSSEMLLKLEIKVSAEDGIAIYDANFPFQALNGNHEASFILGDYPPNPFIIQFTCESGVPITIETTAYLKTKDTGTVQETKTVTVPPAGEN